MSRVLVVEDNPVDRMALKAILESMGHEVDEADDGAVAMRLLNEQLADIVLLDINMPDMDGEEMLGLLRNAWTKDELPVGLVTGLDDKETLDRFISRGANDYIVKPITPTKVKERLASIL